MKGHNAGAIALLLTVAVTTLTYRMPLPVAISAAVLGMLNGLVQIGTIILAAVFLYNLTVESGQDELIKSSISSLSTDRRLQALLIAFCFSAFMEGTTGLGAPVAVCAAMLIGIGFPAVPAALICLAGNVQPVPFGPMGLPTLMMASVTRINDHVLARAVGFDMAVLALIVPVLMLVVLAGWRNAMAVLPAALVAGASYAVTCFLTARYLGPELPAILSSFVSIASLVLFLRLWKPAKPWRFPDDPDAATETARQFATGQIALAWAPFLLPIVPLLFPLLTTMSPAQAPRPWQEITVPSVSEAAANFKDPPREYGAILPFASWNGADPAAVRANIVRDFDRLAANGLFIVNLSPGRRAPGEPPYLSPGHMNQVKFTVAEAAKRNMRLWFQDESDYPSGFAGGYVSARYPQLGMQALLADISVRVYPGETLEMPVPATTMAIWATETQESGQIKQVIQIPVPADGQLTWITPAEGTTPNEPHYNWEVTIMRHLYLSSNTRNFNRADGTRAKDGLYSLIDYLDPKATDAFLHITHDTYYSAVGDQFGKTILGFFGDEPEYQYTPWSPTLQAQFKTQKGYDIAPYMPRWFDRQPTEQSARAAADYTDVWSGIFRSSFFGEQANWAKAHNVEYLVHIGHEETMLAVAHQAADFFRGYRYVQVPGIDNLSKLVPEAVHQPEGAWEVNNNFPKLASSAAHLFGRPQVWSEEGGGSGVDGKFQINYQLVRGINALQIRVAGLRGGGGEAAGQSSAPVPPDSSQTAWYTNRGGYLMVIGRPAAQVGLYHPVNTIWLGGQDAIDADRSTTKLGWQLFEHQVDWDYFDEQSLASVATLKDGGLTNLSGQTYKAIVFPSMTVITRTGLERLKDFAKGGGKVIFVGKTPSLILDRTYLDMKEKPDLSFATLIEPSGDITAAVIAALPKPDVTLNSAFPRLTYTHRKWTDGDMYFFFNESDKAETRTATLEGHGAVQDWDLATGEIHPMLGTTADQAHSVQVPLVLGPYEAKVIVVGPLPRGVAAAEPSFASGDTLTDLNGDWKLDLNGQQITTPIKPWQELGATSFAGPATYSLQFTTTAPPKGKRVYLVIADVHDYAHVTLNGKEVGARSFQPYRWDVTGILKPGANDLHIEVYAGVSQTPVGASSAPTQATPAAAGSASADGTGAPATTGRRRQAGAAPATGPPAAGAARASAVVARPETGLLASVKLVAY